MHVKVYEKQYTNYKLVCQCHHCLFDLQNDCYQMVLQNSLPTLKSRTRVARTNSMTEVTA